MALTAPVRARRAPAARRPVLAPTPARRDPGRAGPPSARRSTRWVRRPAALGATVLVVGSLLATVAAHAYLTQGQIRLARLQQQVAVQINEHRDLELQVSQLENPAHVVVQAQQQGLGAPSQVGDLPQVPLGTPAAAPATTPTTAPTVSTTPPASSRTTVPEPAPAKTAASPTPTTTTVAPGRAGGTR